MISEKQKYLIFDINCYYQLESQTDNIAKGQPIAFFPELGIHAMIANADGERINWSKKQTELKVKLKQYGFSDIWLTNLKNSLTKQLEKGMSPEEFRLKFLTPIDLLTDMLIIIITNADPSFPKETIAENVIENIFDKNYWEGPVVEQINIVRSISSNLELDKDFVIEFGKIFVNQK